MQNLRREYIKIKTSMSETGNSTDAPIVYPEYWDSLVQFLGDKTGLGDIEYGDEANSDDECIVDDGSNSDVSINSGVASEQLKKRKVQIEIDEQRKRRSSTPSKRNDVSNGMITMGSALAKGMVDAANIAAKVAAPTSSTNFENLLKETNKQLTSITSMLEENSRINKKSTEVQEQLLQYLSRKE
jgi:hypothetical protein